MCGILVSCSKHHTATTKHQTLVPRGPDQFEWVEQGDVSFLFHRLAIMDESSNGMQPFQSDNCTLVANAEIYNYKELKAMLSSHRFESDSDCEVLLPLYRELGLDMFSYLDAEFAIVLYDGNTQSIIAARDPIGIRPLFYGYLKHDRELLFASEAKSLMGIVEQVIPFPPGHVYHNGHFTKFHDIDDVTSYHDHLFEDITLQIHKKLISAVHKRLDSDAPMGFLLSGGLDSSLVCAIAQRVSNTPIRTFAIGMDSDPIDLKYARDVANHIGSDHTEVTMTKEDVLGCLNDVIYALETYDITTIRASIGMYLLARYIHQNTDIKVLLTGEVSDELFGYKYTDFAPTPEAFQAESLKRVRELYQYDVLRADRCLAAHSLEARVPFADLDFVSYTLRIAPIFKMNKYRTGKFLLRRAFEGDYLPTHILYRDKAAFSDAVGHSMVDHLKALAESTYDEHTYQIKRINYDPTPISKEALLYREMFETYYPDHAHLIPGYWMPNKDWPGCNVNDPSARVLSNYGNSGK